MTGPIELETAASGKAGAKGMFGAVKRAVAGGSLFMTEYTAEGGAGMVAFATKVPGQILPIEVSEQQTYMVHRGGYLCGLPGVSLEIGFQQKFSAGLFGGAGFILQKVSGDGPAWIELDGEVVTYDLTPGQEIMVHPGHVGMFEAGMAFELERIKGIKNILFGADALFLAKLTGPGKVWLQTLPLPNLAAASCRLPPTRRRLRRVTSAAHWPRVARFAQALARDPQTSAVGTAGDSVQSVYLGGRSGSDRHRSLGS